MKDNSFIVIRALLIAIILSFLYNQTVLPPNDYKFTQIKKTLELKKNSASINIRLDKDAYLLKIKHLIQEDQPKQVFLNGRQINSDYIKTKLRGVIETNYINLHREDITQGRNSIEIIFAKNCPPDLDIILTNYRRILNDEIFILFADSNNVSSFPVFSKSTVLTFTVIFLFFIILFFILETVSFLSIDKFFRYLIYSLLPASLFFISLHIGFNIHGEYRLFVNAKLFWSCIIVSFLIIAIPRWTKLLKEAYEQKKPLSLLRDIQLNRRVIGLLKWMQRGLPSYKLPALEFKRVPKKNIFIYVVILLIICPLFIILHLYQIAEQIVNIAYLLLVLGVVIELIKSKREGART